MRVGFLRALDDRSWDTVVLEVPYSADAPESVLLEWVQATHGLQAQHRRVVLWAVYSMAPDEDSDEL